MLWTWSYPSITETFRQVILRKCCLKTDKEEIIPFCFGQFNKQWFYIYASEVKNSDALSKVGLVSLMAQYSWWDIPSFIRTPPPSPKDGIFLPRRVRIFSSKKPTKFGPFGFHFSKGVGNKLSVRISAILRGGCGYTMERPSARD